MPTVLDPHFGSLTSEMLCEIDARGLIAELSPLWVSTFGYTREEMIGTPVSNFIFLDDIAQIAKRSPELTLRFRKKDGELRWLRWRQSFDSQSSRIYVIAIDITQTHRNELLAIQTERVSRIGSWSIDVSRNELFWSPMNHEIHETDPETYKPTIEEGLKNIPTESRPALERAFKRLLNDGTPYVLDTKLITAKKRKIWVRVDARAETLHGKVVRVYGTIQDITDDKTLREEERAITNRLEFVLDSAEIGSWDWDLEHGTVVFDRRWGAVVGISPEKLPTSFSEWAPYCHPDDIKQVHTAIENYLSGKNEHFQNIHRLRHVDGHWVWVLGRGRVSRRNRDGKATRFSGTIVDISHAKNMETELDNLYSAIDASAILSILDLEGRFISNNQRFCHALGYSEEELASRPFTTISSDLHTEEQQRKITSSLSSGKEWRGEMNLKRKDGGLIWVNTVFFPMNDHEGKLNRYMALMHDITDEVRAREEKAFNHVNVMRAAKLVTVGEMASGMAHDLNNPLAVITSSTEHLLDSREQLSEQPQLIQQLETIHKHAKRMAQIVSEMRRFSRSLADLSKAQRSMSKLLRESVLISEQRARRHGVEIMLEIVQDVDTVCDSVEIEHLLIHLVSNAVDAVKELPERWIKIRLFEESGEAVIQVSDSGTGIPSEVRERVFDPFFSTKKACEGTGLGLSISRGIVVNHGGTLDLLPGPQTCFEVRLRAASTGAFRTAA